MHEAYAVFIYGTSLLCLVYAKLLNILDVNVYFVDKWDCCLNFELSLILFEINSYSRHRCFVRAYYPLITGKRLISFENV